MSFNSRGSCRRWPALAALLVTPWLVAATPEPAAKDPELAKKLPELRGVVEEYRGLRFERPVPSDTISNAELAKKLEAGLHVGAEPAGNDTEALEISLKAFGLIPQSLSLAQYFPKLMGGQIAGFYDSGRKELTLVTGPESLFGNAVAKRYGAVLAGRMQEGLLVHELTHALQDQHFDLSRLAVHDALADPDAARLALVEGDATLVMLAEIAGLEPDQIPLISDLLQKLVADPQQLAAMGADIPGTADLAAAPAWIRGTVLFSYLQGASFCADVLAHGGQRLLDYAFRTDPPRSTEQILHPEKWYGRRDDPEVIAWPDLQQLLPGRIKAAEGQLGELGIRILLQEGLHDLRRGAAAAAGWGGDRFAVYRQAAPAPPGAGGARSRAGGHGGGAKADDRGQAGERTLLAWITDWDTGEDAARFAAAAAALGADWWVDRAGQRRVVVMRQTGGALGGMPAVFAALAGARAEPAANRGIDPAAIDPQRKIGAAGKIIAARLAAKRQEILQDQPVLESRLGADGRTYSFPGVGLTFRLPASMTAWKAQTSPTPALLLILSEPQHGGSFIIAAVDMRQPGISLEMLEPFVEEGLKSSLPGFAKLDGRIVEMGSEHAYELHFTASPAGSELRGVGRILLRGTRYLMVAMTGTTERWPELEPSSRELIDSITVTPLPH
jgi:hypothetical protein